MFHIPVPAVTETKDFPGISHKSCMHLTTHIVKRLASRSRGVPVVAQTHGSMTEESYLVTGPRCVILHHGSETLFRARVCSSDDFGNVHSPEWRVLIAGLPAFWLRTYGTGLGFRCRG